MTTTETRESLSHVKAPRNPAELLGYIPEAHYRCESADAGLLRTEGNHFREGNGGYLPPDQLHYVTFVVKEYDSKFGAFFCEGCLLDLGISKKTVTLAQVLDARTGNILDETAVRFSKHY